MGINEAVRKRIKELRDDKRWKTRPLAQYSGIPDATLRNILDHRTENINIATIKKICDGLNITITDFFDTEEFRNLEQEIK